MSATRSLGSRSRNAGAQVVKPASSDQGPNHGGQGRRRGGEQGGVDKGGAGSGGASSASRPTPQQPKAQSPNQTISKIEARAELLTNLQYLEEHVKNERFNTKLAKEKLKKLRHIAMQQQDDIVKTERAKSHKIDPKNPYYGRRRGEGIHTGKQAKVTVNYVDKVRFEVEPDFQRDTKFTQLWYARNASSPITRGFQAPRATTDTTKLDLDAKFSYQMGNRASPLREHSAGKAWVASNGLNSKDYNNRER